MEKKSPFTKSACKYIHTASTAVLLLRWSLQNFSICTGCWWKLLGKKIIYFFKQVSGHPCSGTFMSSPCVCIVQSLVGTIGVNTSYPVSIGNLLLAMNSGTFGNSNLVVNVICMEFEAINSSLKRCLFPAQPFTNLSDCFDISGNCVQGLQNNLPLESLRSHLYLMKWPAFSAK